MKTKCIGKYCILVLLLITTNNLWAQQQEDPYIKTGAPGFEELRNALNSFSINDLEDTRIWLEKSSSKGNLYATTMLSDMLINGQGGSADAKKGLEGLFFAAKQGYARAYYLLAEIYDNGIYVPQDFECAFNYLKLCVNADKNNLIAKSNLGLYYISGKGTSKNIVKGVELLKDAALSGSPEAQYNLGHVYYYNLEIRNYEEAAKWYSMAADNSIYQASASLALMYANGIGVKQDFEKAHFLIKNAKSVVRDINNLEQKSYTLANLLASDGYIYLKEYKMDEAMAIWNQLKSRYPQYVEDYKFDPENIFVNTMHKQEQQNSILAFSKNNIVQVPTSIISDVDEKIPENAIVTTPTFAVIIANENYKEVEGVPFAIRDGEIFKQYCEKTLGIPKSNIKFETDATFNSIKRQLNWLGQVMDVYQGEANIIFYYAGHGIPDEKDQSAYLLPVDGYGSDVTTGYSLDKLYADLSEKPAKSVVVLLDACFSGAKRDGGMLASARGVAIKAKQNAPKGNMIIFSASQGDETAYPYKEKGHGMFTYYLMKKLQDTKGNVTFGELADYVTTEVKKQSIIVNGKMQTPLVSSSSSASNWQNWKLR